jgi:hypothetical protein
MYKGTSRFRQGLVKKGLKLTSRNLVASDSSPPGRKPIRTRLHQRLNQEVEISTREVSTTWTPSKPGLIKRPKQGDPSI